MLSIRVSVSAVDAAEHPVFGVPGRNRRQDLISFLEITRRNLGVIIIGNAGFHRNLHALPHILRSLRAVRRSGIFRGSGHRLCGLG